MRPDDSIWYHVVTVGGLVSFKLAVLIVGYLFAKLGHDLLIKGVSGDFKFRTEFRGTKADLVSASPGIFFILMATVLIAVAILKDKPFETKVTATSLDSKAEDSLGLGASGAKPTLPSFLPHESNSPSKSKL